ncbi:50S ribosome-binding GTPase [symbiont of Argiope bruennichi]|uniref:GTPase n=1 Tax=symbiont of Argiope bruennichi TaxID=2810479 RepID=UPI003DA3E1DB
MKNDFTWFPGHMKKTLNFFQKEKKKIQAVFFIVDGRIALTTLKYSFFNFFDKPIYLLINKKDLLTEKDITYIKKHLKKFWNFKKVYFFSFKNYHNLKNFFEKHIFSEFIFFSHFLVCGFPNCGKSTLIKRLSQKKINIGKSPAITKSIQLIKVNEKINLIDTAGILPKKFFSNEDYYKFFLVNCIKRIEKNKTEVIDFLFNYLKIYDQKNFSFLFDNKSLKECAENKNFFYKIDNLKVFFDKNFN